MLTDEESRIHLDNYQVLNFILFLNVCAGVCAYAHKHACVCAYTFGGWKKTLDSWEMDWSYRNCEPLSVNAGNSGPVHEQ